MNRISIILLINNVLSNINYVHFDFSIHLTQDYFREDVDASSTNFRLKKSRHSKNHNINQEKNLTRTLLNSK
jgi:hypothetical protein